MKKIYSSIIISLFFLCYFTTNTLAHCEIPCGIYNDKARINMISEHIDTIERSMKQIIKLEKEEHPHFNQLVRWITNKEQHADKLQKIVTQYFMTQRIKMNTKDYSKKIISLHQMLIYSMKCKQTTDLKNVDKLRMLLKQFSNLYFTLKK